MPFDAYPFLYNQVQVEAKQAVQKVKDLKTKKVVIKIDRTPKVLTPEGKEIRKLLITTAQEVKLNLEGFLYNPPNPKRFKALYAYYLLVDARQVAKDYFPPEVNALFLPPLEGAIEFLLPTARRQYTELPSLDDVIRQYVERAATVTFDAESEGVLLRNFVDYSFTFEKAVRRYLSALQELEAEYFGEILTPQTPKEKVGTYLTEALKVNPTIKTQLKPAVEVFLDFVKNKPVKPSPLEEYRYYIQSMEESGNVPAF